MSEIATDATRGVIGLLKGALFNKTDERPLDALRKALNLRQREVTDFDIGRIDSDGFTGRERA